jgi:hypothetical protein
MRNTEAVMKGLADVAVFGLVASPPTASPAPGTTRNEHGAADLSLDNTCWERVITKKELMAIRSELQRIAGFRRSLGCAHTTARLFKRLVRTMAAVVLLAACVGRSSLAQETYATVDLLLSRSYSSEPSTRELHEALRGSIAIIRLERLPLTGSEKWTVAKESLASVRAAAARSGFVVTELGPNSNNVLRSSAEIGLSEPQSALVHAARASKVVTGIGLARSASPAVLEHALTRNAGPPAGSPQPSNITLALDENTVVSVTRSSVTIEGDVASWRGTVAETGAPVVLMLWPNGQMAGLVEHKGSFYSIRHLDRDIFAVLEMKAERMPPDHAPMPPLALVSNNVKPQDDPLVQQGDASMFKPLTMGRTMGMRRPSRLRADAAKSGRSSSARQEVIIDVIVAYTEKAAGNYSDIRRELIDLAIEQANESFRSSNLRHVKLRLVHAYRTDYLEEGHHFDHVWRLADGGDGYMEEVHKLRDAYRADVALLIVDDAKGCGLATRVHADADEAFAVVHHECAATAYTVAHEIGHLIGARHELSMDKTMTPFPYGHGFVNGVKWRDIMSYKESCGGCPRLPIWSSPTLFVKGERAGASNVDNARVIAEEASRVAAFR